MRDLFAHLATLLPEPARVLLLGWDSSADGWESPRREISRASSTAELTPETAPFDAVVWRAEDPGEDAGAAIAGLGSHLADGGRVIVVARLPEGAPVATRRQGSLPGRDEARLREIVQQLSEAGFAVVKDRELTFERRFKVLVARRDRFTVRPYRDGDEAAILRLFRASFHLDRGLDHWRWKYAENPWGRGEISVAAAPDGEIAAHYGGYPIPIWRQGKRNVSSERSERNVPLEGGERNTFLALQIGDTMTDPAARDAGRGKAGLLARTVRHFFSSHRDGSYGFFYGFNTGPIQRFCRWFIGGRQDRPVRYLARDLEPAPVWSAGGYRVERVDSVGPSWDRFFRRAAPHYRFLVRRDARYLDWRYLKRPDARYVILAARRFGRLVGWSVFLRREDTVTDRASIAWGDALFHPRHLQAAEAILAAALADPELSGARRDGVRDDGARRIDAWFSGGPPKWDEQLARLGFVVLPEPQGLGLIALDDAEPEAFERLEEMYTTMGDGDLF